MRPAGLAADAVTVSHEAADFQRRKAIQVGADVGRLPLDFRVHGRRILGRLDHLGNRGEDEAGRVVKRFDLQLPNPVHEDVGRAQGGSDQPAGPAVALHFDPLSHVADEDAVQSAVESAEASMARGLPECGFDQVSVQPELIAGVQNSAARTADMEERFRVGLHGLQTGEKRLALKLVMAQDIPQAGRQSLLTIALVGYKWRRRNVARSPPVGKQQRVWSAAGRRKDVREPSQRRLFADFAGLSQRLDDRLEIEEVILGKRTFRQERPFQAAEHTYAEVVEDAAVRVSLPAELAGAGADVRPRQLQRREKSRESRRSGDGHRHGGQPDVDSLDAKRGSPIGDGSSVSRSG